MNVLGLITARGGSKGIPRKNIANLAGRPLLAYTCEAGRDSEAISRVVISTDDDEIAQVAWENGVEVPFMRPSALAEDSTPSIDVVLHALEWLKDVENWTPDILVLLQPTSPLRTAKHIDEALDVMLRAEADTVVSVVEVPHRFSPYNVMKLEDGRLNHFWKEAVTFNRYRRQELPPLFGRNGPAVLAVNVEVLLERKSFYGDIIVPYIMPVPESIDIDDQFDMEIAEFLLLKRARQGNRDV